jgi:VCBS repeat protein
VDFDGDGQLDLVSGSYDPGELYLFRGQGKGNFAAREVINDKSGKPIIRVPDQKDRVESFGSWMALVDWDADGDLDILVGTYVGTMFVRLNEGTRTKPIYAAENVWVQVGEKRLRVPGEAHDPTAGSGHANPVIADWDGDGRWDIVTGCASGGVYCYRNAGKPGKPRFEPPIALVPAHQGIGYAELLEMGQDPKPGIRSQIAVTDYDGDGKLDVLLGDFCTYLHLKKDLTAAQRREFEKVRKQQEEISTKLRGSMDALQKKYAELMKGVPQSDWHTPENMKKWQDMYLKMKDSKEYTAQREEYERLERAIRKFADRDPTARGGDGSPDTPHGYVWLFRRK